MYHLFLKENSSSFLPKTLLEKIVVRSNISNIESFPVTALAFSAVTGQFPKTNYAKRPLAGFKIRKDQPLGLQVTLRSDNMLSFLKNLIFIVLPKFVD